MTTILESDGEENWKKWVSTFLLLTFVLDLFLVDYRLHLCSLHWIWFTIILLFLSDEWERGKS